jgi:hypothetical protein
VAHPVVVVEMRGGVGRGLVTAEAVLVRGNEEVVVVQVGEDRLSQLTSRRAALTIVSPDAHMTHHVVVELDRNCFMQQAPMCQCGMGATGRYRAAPF